jgi:hypothetical protein
VIAVAGVSFAVLLYLRFDRKPPVEPAPVPEALAKNVSYQSEMSPKGEQCRFENGKEVSSHDTSMLNVAKGQLADTVLAREALYSYELDSI